MGSRFKHYPSEPKSTACQNAYAILCNAHDAASSFLDIFETVRQARGAKGMPTDEEQDLLRAMLIFAAAGLDSMAKQLVTDALSMVIERDPGATEMFKRFIERRLKRAEELDRRFLAHILGDQQPRVRLLDELVADLTSGSLQSTEELLRVAASFNIPSNDICRQPAYLSKIFIARNEIAHEMDVDFSQANRTRRPRAKDMMTSFTSEIFKVSASFLSEVDRKLR
jgi:hypothetical protein